LRPCAASATRPRLCTANPACPVALGGDLFKNRLWSLRGAAPAPVPHQQASGSMQYAQMFSFWTAWAVTNATNLLTALVVLVIGWYGSRLVSDRTGALMARTRRIDGTLRPLIVQLVRYSILAVTLIIVLGQFGVQTASILAVLGAVGLAIALALQGTLSNIAAGVMMIWLRPFHVGEAIDAEGIAGTVLEIGLFGTRLRTFDGIHIFAPNAKIWNSKIINYSREKTRMVDTQIGIGYSADIALARRIMLDIARDPRVLEQPAPSVYVASLGDNAVVIGQRVWVQGKDWWATKIDMIERIKLAFDAAGIEIPHSTRLDVTIGRRNSSTPPPMSPDLTPEEPEQTPATLPAEVSSSPQAAAPGSSPREARPAKASRRPTPWTPWRSLMRGR
jgi:small conductance mechanosensitive channel